MATAVADDDITTAFFYGTLMLPPILRRVLFGPASAHPTTARPLAHPRPAILHGYARRRVRGADYPGIVPRAGAAVRGVLVEGLTPGDVWRLDAFEGGDYARLAVDVAPLVVLPPAPSPAGASPASV